MNKVLSLKQYQLTYHENARPTLKTLRRRCEAGQVPGAYKEGGRWYVRLNLRSSVANVHVPAQSSDDLDLELALLAPQLDEQVFVDDDIQRALRA